MRPSTLSTLSKEALDGDAAHDIPLDRGPQSTAIEATQNSRRTDRMPVARVWCISLLLLRIICFGYDGGPQDETGTRPLTYGSCMVSPSDCWWRQPVVVALLIEQE